MNARASLSSDTVKVGLALPNMATGWTRQTFLDWCRVAEEGPFSSISCGERITFRNTEMITSVAAAAALTTRPRVMVNLAVTPWHETALLAKQMATIDVISDGRLDLGVGVGARGQDFEAMHASMDHRHQRIDEQVAELRRLWNGGEPVPGAPPLGPPVVQEGGPPLYAGALGPKALARAARWAHGITGFSLNADPAELNPAIDAARRAWTEAGRSERPVFTSACFVVCGVPDAAERLRRFTREYMGIFGDDVAGLMADLARLSSVPTLTEALTRTADETDADEIILVPGVTDAACADTLARAVTDAALG